MRIHLLFALFSLLFFACEQETENLDTEYEESIAFTLEHNELATCTCGGPEVKFVNVITDSRCPEPGTCIWAGEVIVALEINEQVIELGLSPINTAPPQVVLGEWSVTLLNVFPHPTDFVDNENIDPSIYTIELLVEML